MIIYITKGLFNAQKTKMASCCEYIKVTRVFFSLEGGKGGGGWSFNGILKMKFYRVTESSYTWVLDAVELL